MTHEDLNVIDAQGRGLTCDELTHLALNIRTHQVTAIQAHPYQLALIELNTYPLSHLAAGTIHRPFSFPVRSNLDIGRDEIRFLNPQGYEVARIIHLDTLGVK